MGCDMMATIVSALSAAKLELPEFLSMGKICHNDQLVHRWKVITFCVGI